MQEQDEEEEEIEREEGGGGAFFKGIINSLNALVLSCSRDLKFHSSDTLSLSLSISLNNIKVIYVIVLLLPRIFISFMANDVQLIGFI